MYDATLMMGGEEMLIQPRWSGNPLKGGIEINWYNKNDKSWMEAYFSPEDIHKIDKDAGAYIFQSPEGHRLTLRKQVPKAVNYSKFTV
jgi:hypothetical protein